MTTTRWFTQNTTDIRFEWGLHGIETLRDDCKVLIIVDVLSFSTSVDIATSRGATVYPYRGEQAAEFAESLNAILADRRRNTQFSLSPHSLMELPIDTRLVLPSPNGSTLSLSTGDAATLAGCLRNAAAVARAAQNLGTPIGVIAAGERWPDGSLRPSLEDMLGAGAIIHHLHGTHSPEAHAAEAVFLAHRKNLHDCLSTCGSGVELIDKGFPQDVALASALNASDNAPRLIDGAYQTAH